MRPIARPVFRCLRIEQYLTIVPKLSCADRHGAEEVSVAAKFHGSDLSIGFQAVATKKPVSARLAGQDQMGVIANSKTNTVSIDRFDLLDHRLGVGLLTQSLNLHGDQEFFIRGRLGQQVTPVT